MRVENRSFNDLWNLLQYVEGLCSGFMGMTEQINKAVKDGDLSENQAAPFLEKMKEGFMEANQASFVIEKEIDARAKKACNLKYGSKTIVDQAKKLQELIESNKTDSPKLKVE